jgi:hypothetical protein
MRQPTRAVSSGKLIWKREPAITVTGGERISGSARDDTSISANQNEKEGTLMGRLAIVTGGTRGIGAAVARRLRHAGHNVAAIYHGNVAAAETFEHETGIKTYMWNVAEFPACEAGINAVTGDFAMPVEILINNAALRETPCCTRCRPSNGPT